MTHYPTLSIVKAVLKEHSLAPRKRLGQNFLIDANVARKSLEMAAIEAGDCVVEIGPGLGALTQLLLDQECEVHAIEKDAGLFRYLEEDLLPQYKRQLHLIHGDAMDKPLASLAQRKEHSKIVANLPYAISTPWLDAVLSGPLPSRMVLMLQMEAVNRFVADPGTRNFGPISLFLKSAYKVAEIHKVAARCFYPEPEVGSAILSLKRLEVPLLFPREIKEGIRQIFRQRRKQISSIIAKNPLNPQFQPWLQELIEQGMDPNTRPEAIGKDQWQLLAG
jgi:16S rRNA (adenine1518-N6/adenine1519-N6)-dimethyltransferase